MSNQPASADPENQVEDEEDEGQEEVKPLHRNRGRPDAFADAFEAAEKQLGGEPKDEKPQAKAKPKPAQPEKEEKPAPKAEKKPESPKPAPKKAEATGAGEDEGEEASQDEKPAPKKADGPLEAKKYWTKERREAFPYQPRHVQEAWLEEAPVPNGHWSEERKAIFAKQPREVQEEWLIHSQDLERGYEQKFQSLAGERKLAEAIRNAVSPQQREVLKARGLDEVGAFSALMRLQEASTKDPVGYVRDFIMRNQIDPRTILGAEGAGENGQGNPAQADITSHPAVRQLQAEINAMKAERAEEARRRAEENDRRIEAEMSGVLAEKDEEGNPAYPYVRVLAQTMAQILGAEPERFDPMGTRQRFVTAYQLALEQFPELQMVSRTAKPAQVDEPAVKDADTDEDEEEAKLQRAATLKSKRPAAAPRDRGDPFAAAFRKAEKRLGQR